MKKQEAIEREKTLKTAKLRLWIHDRIEKQYKSMGFISA